ncbi:MAG TPA: Gfo/Idh/MocA family oxidoreductase [Opitutaceae bacterium]|nr:Gfo/Idh/MocA family oxidoreductase [Opitutaceae bacterium]
MITRRTFLKTSAWAAAGTALSARSWGQVAGANGTIRVAVVGLHSRGRNLVQEFSAVPGVKVVALCDVDSAVLAKASADFSVPDTTREYRNLLARPDIDAVALATPNHWHALQAIWACQAGKDPYVEKPVSHEVWEGQQMCAAIRKYNRIAQAGSQSRSSPSITEAVAWVRAGNLGKITAARGLCYKRRDSIGLTTGPQPVPKTVDYDLWLGPAPYALPRRKQFHYDWHWFWDTGNGDIGNQGLHQMDVARWFLGEEAVAPSVMAVGGRLGYVDDAQTPNTLAVVHAYEAAPLIFEVRGLPAKAGARNMDEYLGTGIGTIVHCEGGHVLIPALNYTWAEAYDRDGKLVKRFQGGASHPANFIKAVRSRRTADLNIPVASSHLSSCLSHFSNISYRLGQATSPGELQEKVRANPALAEAAGRMLEHLRANEVDLGKTPATFGCPLQLDAASQSCVGNPAANALLTRSYRPPYVVPDEV